MILKTDKFRSLLQTLLNTYKKRISQHVRTILRVWYTGLAWQYSYLNTSYDNSVAVLKLYRKRINSQTLDLEIALNQTLPYKNNSGRSQHFTNEVLRLQDLEMQGKRSVWIGENTCSIKYCTRSFTPLPFSPDTMKYLEFPEITVRSEMVKTQGELIDTED